MDPKTFATQVRAAIETCRENAARFAALPPDASFATVVEAFDRITAPLNGSSGRVGLFTHVHPDAAVREQCEELEQEIAALGTELSLNRELYDRLAELDPAQSPGPTEARLFEHALRDFRRSGVDRDAPTRERIRVLRDELVKVGQDFDRNIVQGGQEFVVEEGHAGLAGMPPDFLASHPEREDGSVVLTTDPTDRIPFLSFADRDDIRGRYYRVCANRAHPENLEVLERLLAKRHELATLLGYGNWADYVTEELMSKSGARAREFIERVVGLVRDRAREEVGELLALKAERGSDATEIMESERIYLTEKMKERRFGFDARSVRSYFPFAAVKRGVLATSAALYGVTFRQTTDFDAWHSSVECYEILDGDDVIARFYLDMHPREGKYKHAAMMHVAEGVAGEALPEAALVCNFPEPTDADPALLLHDQVTTFFHEFGHLLHHLFAGGQRFLAFSGISTEHDFVEVPSQMYEEWAWNADVLRTFAVHVESGEPIPTELVENLRVAEEYGKALHTLQQMYYALLSLSYYDRDPADLDLTQVMIDLKRELLVTTHEEGTHFHASFGHLHGYSAIYYTYMWSLVIAKDLFSRFESDPMNGATANAYREAVLAPGGSKDAADLVRDFLGREYAFDSFERWLAR